MSKRKVSISTDVVFESSYTLFEVQPAMWCVYLSRQDEQALAYTRCYQFVAKPTRKQIRKARSKFIRSYELYENHNC